MKIDEQCQEFPTFKWELLKVSRLKISFIKESDHEMIKFKFFKFNRKIVPKGLRSFVKAFLKDSQTIFWSALNVDHSKLMKIQLELAETAYFFLFCN